MKNILRTLLNSRYLSFWSYIFVSIIAPVLIVSHHYNILERHWAIQIGLPTSIVTIWALVRFWSTFLEAAEVMKEGIARETVLATLKLAPYITIYLFGLLIEIFFNDYMFVATVLLLTQSTGVMFEANHRRILRAKLMDRGYVNVLPR